MHNALYKSTTSSPHSIISTLIFHLHPYHGPGIPRSFRPLREMHLAGPTVQGGSARSRRRSAIIRDINSARSLGPIFGWLKCDIQPGNILVHLLLGDVRVFFSLQFFFPGLIIMNYIIGTVNRARCDKNP